eukprot:g28412.t1
MDIDAMIQASKDRIESAQRRLADLQREKTIELPETHPEGAPYVARADGGFVAGNAVTLRRYVTPKKDGTLKCSKDCFDLYQQPGGSAKLKALLTRHGQLGIVEASEQLQDVGTAKAIELIGQMKTVLAELKKTHQRMIEIQADSLVNVDRDFEKELQPLLTTCTKLDVTLNNYVVRARSIKKPKAKASDSGRAKSKAQPKKKAKAKKQPRKRAAPAGELEKRQLDSSSEDDVAGELIQSVEQGSVPAYRAVEMAGVVRRKLQKHGIRAGWMLSKLVMTPDGHAVVFRFSARKATH